MDRGSVGDSLPDAPYSVLETAAMGRRSDDLWLPHVIRTDPETTSIVAPRPLFRRLPGLLCRLRIRVFLDQVRQHLPVGVKTLVVGSAANIPRNGTSFRDACSNE